MDLTARFLSLARVDINDIVPGSGTLLEEAVADDTSPALVHRGRVQRQTRLDEPELLQLIASYLDGESVAVLARHFELHEHTVHQHLNRMEIPRHRYRKIKPHQVAEAIELYQADASLRAVARWLGVATDTARRALVEAGVEIRGR